MTEIDQDELIVSLPVPSPCFPVSHIDMGVEVNSAARPAAVFVEIWKKSD